MFKPILKAAEGMLLLALLATPAQAQIRVELGAIQVRAPRVRVDLRLEEPGYTEVWVPGRWERQERRYESCEQRWERPEPRYESCERGWERLEPRAWRPWAGRGRRWR